MPIEPVDIVDMESKAGNIYESIVVCAKRARQLNNEDRIEYTQRLEPLMEVETEDENVVSKDKQNISLDFEKRLKPTEIGINELLNDELTFRARTEE